MLRKVADSHAVVEKRAEDAFKRGNYAEGMRHVLGYLIPVIGPAIDEAGNKAQAGKVAEGLGEATGIGLSNMMAGRAAMGPKMPVAKVKKTFSPTLNPVQENALEVAQAKGVTVPPDIATQNKFLQSTRNILERQPVTAGPLSEFRNGMESQIAGVLSKTAEEAAPGAARTKLTAGMNSIERTKARLDSLHQQARSSYDRLQEISTRPENVKRLQTGTQQVLDEATGEMRTEPVFEDIAGPVDLTEMDAGTPSLP
jgi:hypothetical protein